MTKRIIILTALAISVFALSCTSKETSSAGSKPELVMVLKENKPEDIEIAKAEVAESEPIVTPEPVLEDAPPAEEPNVVTHAAKLTAYVEPEPEPEPNYDYYEGVETGEYHEDVPAADYGEYVGDWTITFYCTGSCCNGSYTGTASGAPLTPWHTAACTALPFGTRVYIEGVGEFTIEDTGVSGEWIDCCVDSHQQALDLGMRTAAVYIVG